MNREHMVEQMRVVLVEGRRPMTKKELAKVLAQRGVVASTSEINSLLYGHPESFSHDLAPLPRWSPSTGRWAREARASERPSVPPAAPVTPSASRYSGPRLRAWQSEAVEKWVAAGHCGVVEAVTGTGKTAVGLKAVACALETGRKVAIIVPTLELQDQWLENLRLAVSGSRIGRLGGGHADSLQSVDVLLSTVQSASRRNLLPRAGRGLIVADEVHRLGAPSFRDALQQGFDWRIGLTATLEREDDGVKAALTPYFGGKVGACTYRRGLADGILAHFRIAFVPSPFTAEERDLYDEADENVRSAWGSLVHVYDLTPEPFGVFMAEVTELADGPFGDPAVRTAMRYLSAFSKRRTLLADASRKIELLGDLGPTIVKAHRSLVFTETKQAAEAAAAALSTRGVAATALHSDLTRDERRDRMQAFRAGQIQVLAAPRVLDEGIDVPEAELAVILASSRSRRQMIQRMGRVIRPKADGRRAAFVVLYVPGTSEDPSQGAHEDFLSLLTDEADDIRTLDGPVPAKQMASWLSVR